MYVFFICLNHQKKKYLKRARPRSLYSTSMHFSWALNNLPLLTNFVLSSLKLHNFTALLHSCQLRSLCRFVLLSSWTSSTGPPRGVWDTFWKAVSTAPEMECGWAGLATAPQRYSVHRHLDRPHTSAIIAVWPCRRRRRRAGAPTVYHDTIARLDLTPTSCCTKWF